MRYLMLAPLAIAALVAATSLAAPAYAFSPQQQCDTGGYCLNAWGYPQPNQDEVRAYTSGVSNNDFQIEGVDRCDSSNKNDDYTTANCPSTGVPAGLYIFQIEDQNTGGCIGNDGTGASAWRTDQCNETGYPGTGGTGGTIFIQDPVQGCPDGTYNYVNSYWTSKGGGWSTIREGIGFAHADGAYIGLNQTSMNCLQQVSNP
jgi:hypothetical protein